MDIKKGKLYELGNMDHNKFIRYKQIIRNNTLNELIEIEEDNLNDLITEVRKQINRWNNI